METPRQSKYSGLAIGAIAGYAVLYGASIGVLGQAPGFPAGESVAILLIFGLGFSAIAWLATKGVPTRPVVIARPGAESLAILAYLAVFAAGFLGYGLSALRDALPDGPVARSGILAAKVLAMVAAPAAILLWNGVAPGALVPGGTMRLSGGREWRCLAILCGLVLVLQFTVGRGPQELARLQSDWGWPAWKLAAVAPLALAWMSVEAGLTEEFLFRLALQTRLEAWLRSPTAAIVIMAIVFGLAHAPGYVLRGGHLAEGMTAVPGALAAAAYAIAVVSPIGLMFGVLWARTRSLGLVVALHGFTDLVPNLAAFVRTFFVPG